MRLIHWPCILIGFVALAGCGREEPKGRVWKIGYRENPPYLEWGADGTARGLAPEVLNEAARLTGMRLEWVRYRGPNHQFLGSGQGELWPLADPMDSNGYGVTEPWLRDSFTMVTKRGGGAGRRVAVNDAARTRGLLRAHGGGAEEVVRRGGGNVLSAMCSGEAEGAFLNSRLAQQLLLDRPAACAGMPLVWRSMPEATIPLGIAYRPEAREAAERLRQGVDVMTRNGSLGPVFAKWSHSANNDVELRALLLQAESRREWAVWFATGLAGLLALLGAMAAAMWRANRAEAAAHRARSLFLGMVSHELRTPLHGMLGMVDLLSRTRLDEEQRGLVESAQTSVGALRRIVDDVVECSIGGGPRMEMAAGPVEVGRVVETAMGGFRGAAEQKGLWLRCEGCEGMPVVTGDRDRLYQLLFQLIDNAVKFTESGGISVRVGWRDGELTLEVSDTGIGMEAGKVDDYFAAFEQAESGMGRRFGGMGLGLAASRKIVDGMDGTITVRTAPGAGTTVTVRAPAALAVGAATEEEIRRGLRVLVVDDNAVNRRVASQMLLKLGHTVETAGNGAEAVARWELGGIDVILMDCQMPVMDGFAAARRIREIEKGRGGGRTPILALTASVEASDAHLCAEAGMDAFLSKPLSMAELERAVR